MVLSLIQPLLFLGALLAAASLFPSEITPAAALLLNLGAAICFLAVVHMMQWRLERQSGLDSHCETRPKEWLGTATPMLLIAGLVYLQGRTGVIISGILLDASAAGTYAAAERLADVALLGLISVNYLIAPKFSAMHSLGRWNELQRYARLAALGSTAVMLIVTVPLVVFGKQVLQLFGDEFVAGYPVLLLLLGGVAVNALCGSAGILLQMTGHHRRLLGILAAGLLVNVALSFLLVPKFGIVGVAWANALAVVCWNVGTVYTVRIHLGIWPQVGRIDSSGII
jgi:O-antigen/teichoic acid export membrane protein